LGGGFWVYTYLMTQTSTATQITAQIAQARQTMQHMIQLGFGIEMRERQERRINALKAKLAAAGQIGSEYLATGPCGNASGRCNHWPQHSA
jgi:hypothetical protein